MATAERPKIPAVLSSRYVVPSIHKLFIPARCRLKDKRFEQLMFIRCNNSVVKNAS